MTKEEFINEVIKFKGYEDGVLTDKNISIETATDIADAIEKSKYFTYKDILDCMKEVRGEK